MNQIISGPFYTTTGNQLPARRNEQTVFDLLTGNFINPTTGGVFGVSPVTGWQEAERHLHSFQNPTHAAILGLGISFLIHGRRFKDVGVSPPVSCVKTFEEIFSQR